MLQSSLIILKRNDAWKYLKHLKSSPLMITSTVNKVFKVMLKNMLMVDVDFHLNNAYEQYRSYTTPDTISDMLKMVLYIFNYLLIIYLLILKI